MNLGDTARLVPCCWWLGGDSGEILVSAGSRASSSSVWKHTYKVTVVRHKQVTSLFCEHIFF